MQIVDGPQLNIKQVAHLAMRVGGIANAIELQIGVAKTGLSSLAAELGRLREFNAVGRGLHRVVANFAGVAHGIQEVR